MGAAGFSGRSAFLTSPTFGGLSWLAHSTLQTGLPITDQVRYNAVLDSPRLTLASAFGAAGWRTVLVSPADENDISPVTRFYGYDALYDGPAFAFRGPKFGYAPVPDQFTLTTLAQRELTPGPRPPLMAEVDLVSSHTPWAPLPRLLDPATLGDGSAYQPVFDRAATADAVWSDPARVKQAYADSVAYALDSLTSFVVNAHDDNLVLVVLGDHQPSAVISGADGAATTCRCRSSPRTPRCSTGSVAGAGSPGSSRAPRPRSGRWTRSATASSARSARPVDRPRK